MRKMRAQITGDTQMDKTMINKGDWIEEEDITVIKKRISKVE